MNIFAHMLRPGRQGDHLDPDGLSRLQAATRERTRRELVTMAVRDTLKKHGLGATCLAADALPSTTASKQRGLHVQLVIRDWQPSLLSYVVAIEAAVKSRLERLDPLSATWVTGVSWRFEPQVRSEWPSLPVPGDPVAALQPPSVDRARPAAAPPVLHGLDDAPTPARRARHAPANAFSPTLPMAHGH